MKPCCSSTISGKMTTACPECGVGGKTVGIKTLRNLIAGSGVISNRNYRFCATSDCPVVYYDGEGSTVFRKKDLVVRIGLKETVPPIPVCYCFDITEEDIRAEIRGTGNATASRRIRAEVETGRCACEIKNPSGRCCLPFVKKTEERLRQEKRDDPGGDKNDAKEES